MGDYQLVATVNTRPEADLMKMRLEANGIKVIIQADDLGGMAPFPMQPSSTGVKIMVHKDDLEYAQELLSQKEK